MRLQCIGSHLHYRGVHGRLTTFGQSFRQGRLCFNQLERQRPGPSADGVVQRVAPALVLLQDRLVQLPVTAVPEEDGS
jgi:hypothetical protein